MVNVDGDTLFCKYPSLSPETFVMIDNFDDHIFKNHQLSIWKKKQQIGKSQYVEERSFCRKLKFSNPYFFAT